MVLDFLQVGSANLASSNVHPIRIFGSRSFFFIESELSEKSRRELLNRMLWLSNW